MPPLEAGGYLVELLFEIGPVKPAGMAGVTAIDESDVAAWQRNQGLELTAWEARTLRLLSREYAAMLATAVDIHCPPPWVPEKLISDEKREKIAEAMSNWADRVNGSRK